MLQLLLLDYKQLFDCKSIQNNATFSEHFIKQLRVIKSRNGPNK